MIWNVSKTYTSRNTHVFYLVYKSGMHPNTIQVKNNVIFLVGLVLVPKQGRRSRYSNFVLLCVTRVDDQAEDIQDVLDGELVARGTGINVMARSVVMVRNMRVNCAVGHCCDNFCVFTESSFRIYELFWKL